MIHKIIYSSATPIKSARLLQIRTIFTDLQNGENLDKNNDATDHIIKKPLACHSPGVLSHVFNTASKPPPGMKCKDIYS